MLERRNPIADGLPCRCPGTRPHHFEEDSRGDSVRCATANRHVRGERAGFGSSHAGHFDRAIFRAFDAKTHLADLLDRVGSGEKITITRHGVPAAMLVVEEIRTGMTHKEIVEGMRALRKRIKPGKMSVRQMVQGGRRF